MPSVSGKSGGVRKHKGERSLSDSGLSAIFQSIESPLEAVRTLIGQQLSDCGTVIGELAAAFSGSSGKMLRPAMVLLSGKCFGDITDSHIRAAAVVQMIHNATLLHDDVIDNGKYRRGSPTINSLWGNEAAVLFGDLVLSKASMLCAEMEGEIFRIIAAATSRVCAGELRQILNRNNWKLSEQDYIEIITEKSASLFAACCQAGAMLSGAGDAEAAALCKFGLHTGVAFQITDDLLDIVGDEKQTGKTGGSDFDRNKLTLAVIHLLGTMTDKEPEEFIRRYLDADASMDMACSRDKIVKMLERSGSLEYARRRAQDYISRAIEALEAVKASAARASLVEAAKFIEERTL
jgi:octaprenyl-diphosphate synthase